MSCEQFADDPRCRRQLMRSVGTAGIFEVEAGDNRRCIL